jgi:predicted glycosyltransferase
MARSPQSPKTIWVDLDNSPHVPFFRPIVERLKGLGHSVLITARDAYQVTELLDYYQIPASVVGKHYGRSKLLKGAGTIWRAASLTRFVRGHKPDLAISHGSRACLLSATFLKIPNITLADYEFVAKVPKVQPTWMMVPDVIPSESLVAYGPRVLKYPGLKEDVYLADFHSDASLRQRLGITSDHLLVTVRPPASEAHYHNHEADGLLTAVLNRLLAQPDARTLLLPRNKRQEAELRTQWAEGLLQGKILIPERVEDGMNLIWNSDLVISGGGTMNREAAALGVPVYSIFRGKIGAVDRYLAEQRRLVLIESEEDVRTKINLVRRRHSPENAVPPAHVSLDTIVKNVCSILEKQAPVCS